MSREPDARRVPWPHLENARDLGGLPTQDGRPTLGRRLVRSDTPERLTPHGRALMLAHGIRTVLDLRPCGEATGTLDGVTSVCVPLVPPDFPFPIPLAKGYQRILDEHSAQLAAALRSVARAAPGGVFFHCHSGTGRTGLVALLLLSVAGVTTAAIQDDYLMSYRPGEAVPEARAVVPSALAHIEARYGSLAAYLIHAGITDAEVQALRRHLLGDMDPRDRPSAD